jgi:type I restriction enzyme M protein
LSRAAKDFVQHVVNVLKPGGQAAMVLPDNCLFKGKAGEVFEILMQDCNLHTVLRLPRGTFTPYSQGVNANVIFFQKGLPTEDVWVFDARSNVPGITKKDRPLSPQHFAGFEKCYSSDPAARFFPPACRRCGSSPWPSAPTAIGWPPPQPRST